MKTRTASLVVLAASLFLAGCATSDRELSQKEKDKIERDMARSSQKQAQEQEKMMRQSTQGGQRRGTR